MNIYRVDVDTYLIVGKEFSTIICQKQHLTLPELPMLLGDANRIFWRKLNPIGPRIALLYQPKEVIDAILKIEQGTGIIS